MVNHAARYLKCGEKFRTFLRRHAGQLVRLLFMHYPPTHFDLSQSSCCISLQTFLRRSAEHVEDVDLMDIQETGGAGLSQDENKSASALEEPQSDW